MVSMFFVFCMLRRPPSSTRTATLFPCPTLFRSRIFSILLGIGNGFAEHFNLGDAQPPGPFFAGKFLGALRWVGGQQPFMLGVADDRLKRAKASGGNTGPTGSLSAPATAACLGGFPVLHI